MVKIFFLLFYNNIVFARACDLRVQSERIVDSREDEKSMAIGEANALYISFTFCLYSLCDDRLRSFSSMVFSTIM